MFCPKCGIKNEDEALFCLNCGEKFTEQQNPQVYHPQIYYTQPTMPIPGRGMAIASLVLGIVSVSTVFFVFYIAIIAGIVGIVLGVMSKQQMAWAGAPTGIATTGLVLSIIGLVVSVILLTYVISILYALLASLRSCVNPSSKYFGF